MAPARNVRVVAAVLGAVAAANAASVDVSVKALWPSSKSSLLLEARYVHDSGAILRRCLFRKTCATELSIIQFSCC